MESSDDKQSMYKDEQQEHRGGGRTSSYEHPSVWQANGRRAVQIRQTETAQAGVLATRYHLSSFFEVP